MIRETELSLFVPSPELLVRLASGDRPLGVRAGPPRIKAIRETFFDTPDQTLRRRGMTCKLRQVEGEEPAVVVTVGEGPDSEGITSRSRLTAAAVGAGVFETLRGDSEAAAQIQKFVDPSRLRPQLALEVQRLGRVFRGGLLLKPVLLLFFDRITVEAGGASSVFHEISIRRRREGGPVIRDLARSLRDQFHLFPDGLNRLQRAYRILAMEGKRRDQGLSPYGLHLVLAVTRQGRIGLLPRDGQLTIPTFRGSGEDAARALLADLAGSSDLPLLRLGVTEPREGRALAEVWAVEETPETAETLWGLPRFDWVPWSEVVDEVGRKDLRHPTLVSTLLVLTRKKLLGQLPWLQASGTPLPSPTPGLPETPSRIPGPDLPGELQRLGELLPLLMEVEDAGRGLRERLSAVTRLSAGLTRIFYHDATRAKGNILSGEGEEGESGPVLLLDFMSIRIRGILDRLHQCLETDLIPRLEEADVHLRPWEGLMNADRVAVLEHFSREHLPHMQVAPEWGPAFVPDMPMAGCALGLLARVPGVDGPRFFHMVLRKNPPSFIPVPGSSTVLPLEEVVRGYFLHRVPGLERAELHIFRFTTGAAVVREPAVSRDDARTPEPGNVETGSVVPTAVSGEAASQEPVTDATPATSESSGTGTLRTSPSGSSPGEGAGLVPTPQIIESRQSVVVRVLVHRRMPESYQAQLLRALERQVTRRNPLIGWSDLYPVRGPLELTGIDELLDLGKK